MSIVVITAKPEVGSIARLSEAAAARGIRIDVVSALGAVAAVGGLRTTEVTSEAGLAVDPPSCVLARIGNWRPDSLLSLLEAYEAQGVRSPNPASAMRCGRDHWATVQRLGDVGLPVPRTLAGADPETLARFAAAEIGFPLVVKTRRSRMGVGVIRCLARDQLDAVLDSLWRVGEELVVQAFVGPPGRSVRALVVDGQVVAAAEFSARDGEWRSNGARGGDARALSLDATAHRLAVKAAQAVGLTIAGVDLLEGSDGPVICEVNPTPGFIRLEAATSADVAGAVVDALFRQSEA